MCIPVHKYEKMWISCKNKRKNVRFRNNDSIQLPQNVGDNTNIGDRRYGCYLPQPYKTLRKNSIE